MFSINNNNSKPKEQVTLEPYERDHAVVILNKVNFILGYWIIFTFRKEIKQYTS